MSTTDFIPGLELSALFFREVVRPLLVEHWPELRYTAALIGPGSEVLGYDTELSSDHHWGPRVMLFLDQKDLDQIGEELLAAFTNELPYSFLGYSTHFTPPDPHDHGTQLLQVIDSGPVNHRVELLNLDAYFRMYLGIDPANPLTPVDWLTIPGQKLLSVTAGAVYWDGIGELTRLREMLEYYPDDIWLYMLAAGWARIGQEEHIMGRCGFAGDELGSRLIAARLVHDLMNLCFLIERKYPPYSKWFGIAFQRLACAPELLPLFDAVMDAQTWQERELPLCQAYHVVANLLNGQRITEPIPSQVSSFHGRPFQVIHAEVYAEALKAQIRNPDVAHIAQLTDCGALEQFSTSSELLSDTRIAHRIRSLYL